jgi:hydroxypyruvate isomerase
VPHTRLAVNVEMWRTKLPFLDRIRQASAYIGYLRLADHPGRNEPGTGELHYNRVLQEAYDLGYRGLVGLELRPQTTELAAAIASAKAYIW